MDLDMFRQKLEDLVVECGGMALDDFSVEVVRRETLRGFIPQDQSQRGLDALDAVRVEQPIKILFSVHSKTAGHWHHKSGDDRRLHPDLRSES